jgi:hypothetical protein
VGKVAAEKPEREGVMGRAAWEQKQELRDMRAKFKTETTGELGSRAQAEAVAARGRMQQEFLNAVRTIALTPLPLRSGRNAAHLYGLHKAMQSIARVIESIETDDTTDR